MKFNRFDSGVYAIFDNKGNCLYVGASKNILNRYNDHVFHLRSNNHKNEQLQLICNNIGIDNLEFIVIFYCHEDNIFLNEQRFISILCPICNRTGKQMESDYKFNEMGDKNIIYNIIKTAYPSEWVNMEDIELSLADLNASYTINKKVIGSVLRSFGIQKKRVGINRESIYFIQ